MFDYNILNMANVKLIDLAYQIAHDNYKNKPFKFENLWDVLSKKYKISAEEKKEKIGNLYVETLQDHRFLYVGNKQWMLREYLKNEQIKKLTIQMYDLNNSIDNQNLINDIINDTTTDNDLPEEKLIEVDETIEEDNTFSSKDDSSDSTNESEE